jgi:hypothetical protein
MKKIITDYLYISLLLLPIYRSYDFYLLQLKFVNSMFNLLLLQHLFALLTILHLNYYFSYLYHNFVQFLVDYGVDWITSYCPYNAEK